MRESKESELLPISFRAIAFEDIEELERIERLVYQEDANERLGMNGIMGSLMLEKQQRKNATGSIPQSFVAEVGGQIAGFMIVMLNPSEGDSEEYMAITQWVTNPQLRSVRLVKGMLTHLFSQWKDKPIVGAAREDTTYKAAKQPGMQAWLRTQGYAVQDMYKLPSMHEANLYRVRLQPIKKQS